MNQPYTKVGVGILIIKDGKALITKRKGALGHGMYGTVGGHVDYGENPAAAAIREAKEELGIDVGNLKFLCCASIDFSGKHYIDISFTGDIISGEPKIMEPDKIESADWYALDNLPGPFIGPVTATFEALKTGEKYFEIKH